MDSVRRYGSFLLTGIKQNVKRMHLKVRHSPCREILAE